MFKQEKSPNEGERTKLHQHVWETNPEVALKEVAGYFAVETEDKEAGTGALNLQVLSQCVSAARERAATVHAISDEAWTELSQDEKDSWSQLSWMPTVARKTMMEQIKPTEAYREARLDVGLGKTALEVTALRDPSIIATEAYADLATIVDEASVPLDAIAERF